MRILIQRVLSASVSINEVVKSSIKNGFLIYVCFEKDDSPKKIDTAIEKIISLRIIEDQHQRMNLNINQKNLEILAISQFTLSWTGEKGNRPNFTKSMDPLKAKDFYSNFCKELNRKLKSNLQTGVFAANMKIESINDGPINFFLSF